VGERKKGSSYIPPSHCMGPPAIGTTKNLFCVGKKNLSKTTGTKMCKTKLLVEGSTLRGEFSVLMGGLGNTAKPEEEENTLIGHSAECDKRNAQWRPGRGKVLPILEKCRGKYEDEGPSMGIQEW